MSLTSGGNPYPATVHGIGAEISEQFEDPYGELKAMFNLQRRHNQTKLLRIQTVPKTFPGLTNKNSIGEHQ